MTRPSLPIVDIAGLRSDDSAARMEVGRAIRAACLDQGFLYVTGHGIDPALVDEVYARSREFFESPIEARMAVSCEGDPIRRGYEPLRAQRLEPGTAPDLKESFYIGREIAANDPRPLAGQFDCGPNRWPDLPALNPQNWRSAMERYFAEMLTLGRTLYGGLALSLDLTPDYFETLCDEPHCTLRLLRYPPQPDRANPNQRGIGAHTDFGGLTLLSQDGVGGLQIHDGDDGWIDVPPLAGAYVINLGDMIARWTNDRYRSTLHRVINRSAQERYSVTFFMNGNPDHVVACLPTCLTAGETPHYPPTTVERHIRERIRQTYEQNYAAAAG